jgi:hypothetical protein
MKEAANQGGLFLFGHSTRSITLGKDEAHIVHILHRKVFDIRMINVHLENIPTSKAEEYLAIAKRCEESAAVSHDPEIKAQLIDIARRWREMAKDIEWIEKFRGE